MDYYISTQSGYSYDNVNIVTTSTRHKAGKSKSDLLSEEGNELLVVQHPVIVLVHHGYELLSFGAGAGHPSMLREYLGELLAADTTASSKF